MVINIIHINTMPQKQIKLLLRIKKLINLNTNLYYRSLREVKVLRLKSTALEFLDFTLKISILTTLFRMYFQWSFITLSFWRNDQVYSINAIDQVKLNPTVERAVNMRFIIYNIITNNLMLATAVRELKIMDL